MNDVFEQSFSKLLRYCRSESWVGYDPYDALNSPLAWTLPFRNKFARTALTQLVKRSVFNMRPILGIDKRPNPKGIALAIRALFLQTDMVTEDVRLQPDKAIDSKDTMEVDISFLIKQLVALRTNSFAEACWGYNFDWQSRAFFAPRNTPNVVCTVFAAQAYFDWYERTRDEAVLEIVKSSCRFLLDRLNRSAHGDGECFSYTPLDHSRVHNVNLLAAELLARTFAITGIDEYRDAALRATRYTLSRQRDDGSWLYGEDESQAWIDSFHTGFILVSLKHLIEFLEVPSWRAALEVGYGFYEKRFFLADGTPGYYHDKLHPHDVHSAAQGIITFVEMTDLTPNAKAMAARVIRWTIDHLQDPSGFFYFQIHRFYTIKTSYMRWAQSWMLYALSLYLSRNRIINNV